MLIFTVQKEKETLLSQHIRKEKNWFGCLELKARVDTRDPDSLSDQGYLGYKRSLVASQ